MIVVVTILAVAAALVIGFAAGARYTRTRLLPLILARMSTGEMSELGERVTIERAQLRSRIPPAHQ